MRIFTETEHLQYKDVAVGEVWVAGGQSNMESGCDMKSTKSGYERTAEE